MQKVKHIVVDILLLYLLRSVWITFRKHLSGGWNDVTTRVCRKHSDKMATGGYDGKASKDDGFEPFADKTLFMRIPLGYI